MFEGLVPSCWNDLRKIERGGFGGGGVPLREGLKVLKAHAIPNELFLLPACGLIC